MKTIKTSNFKELDSVFKGMWKIYFKKNIENITEYKSFLKILKKRIQELLSNVIEDNPKIYCLKIQQNLGNSAVR